MSVELWECENCGERAINGVGAAWEVVGDAGRRHRCARLPKYIVASAASRVTLHNTEAALAALTLSVDLFAADEGGVPYEMREAYIAACDALGLPRPELTP